MAIAIVAISCSPQRSSAEYLPVAVVGQWNGVWWHWCQDCSKKDTFVYATDSRMHGLGEKCDNIYDPLRFNNKIADIKDPDKIKTVLKIFLEATGSAEAPQEGLAPNLDGKQKKYVPLRKKDGADGSADDPEDGFQIANENYQVKEYGQAQITDGKGVVRFFRLLIISHRTDTKLPAIRIGQELHPGDGDAKKAIKFEYKDKFGKRQILLKEPKDLAFYVWHLSCYKDYDN